MAKVDGLKAGAGFFDFTAGAAGKGSSFALEAQTDVGVKLTPSVDLFAFGRADMPVGAPRDTSWATGVGVKGTF